MVCFPFTPALLVLKTVLPLMQIQAYLLQKRKRIIRTWGTAIEVVGILTLSRDLFRYPNPDRCTTPTTNTSFSGYEAFWRTPARRERPFVAVLSLIVRGKWTNPHERPPLQSLNRKWVSTCDCRGAPKF